MDCKETYKFTFDAPPYFVEQVRFAEFTSREEAKAYATGIESGGSRNVKMKRVITSTPFQQSTAERRNK